MPSKRSAAGFDQLAVKFLAALVVVGRAYEIGVGGHGGDRAADQRQGVGSDGTSGADVARARVGIKVVIAEGVDCRLDDDQADVVDERGARPVRLTPPTRKAREAAVLDLEADDAARAWINVRKEDVSAAVDAIATEEAWVALDIDRDAAVGEVTTRGSTRPTVFFGRPGLIALLGSNAAAVEFDGDFRPVLMEPGAELLADLSKATRTPLLEEVDDRAVVSVAPNRKVGPVLIAIAPNDDLVVAVGMPHRNAGSGAAAPLTATRLLP